MTRAPNVMPSQERLQELFRYDPKTGELRWRIRPYRNSRRRAGDLAGYPDKSGYIIVGIDNEVYVAHRLIWKYMTGKDPTHEIDHENGIPGDDWWDNLREATRKEQEGNTRLSLKNTSGVKGVYWSKPRSLWVAQIKDRSNGTKAKTLYLGSYENIEDAKAAYTLAAQIHFGQQFAFDGHR